MKEGDKTKFGTVTLVQHELCFVQFRDEKGYYFSKTYEEIFEEINNA